MVGVNVRANAATKCCSDHHHDGSGEDSANGRHQGTPDVEKEK